MIKRYGSLGLVAAALLCLPLLAPRSTVAGDLDRPEITDYRVWNSNRCYKPKAPPTQITDALTFNLAVEAFNTYLADMKAYLDCASNEANEDYAAMKSVLEQGLSRTREDALEDLERERDRIQQYRALYAQPSNSAEMPAPARQ